MLMPIRTGLVLTCGQLTSLTTLRQGINSALTIRRWHERCGAPVPVVGEFIRCIICERFSKLAILYAYIYIGLRTHIDGLGHSGFECYNRLPVVHILA